MGQLPAGWPVWNKGAVAAFLPRPKPLDLGELSFVDGEGVTKSLSDWRGKVVLLNVGHLVRAVPG